MLALGCLIPFVLMIVGAAAGGAIGGTQTRHLGRRRRLRGRPVRCAARAQGVRAGTGQPFGQAAGSRCIAEDPLRHLVADPDVQPRRRARRQLQRRSHRTPAVNHRQALRHGVLGDRADRAVSIDEHHVERRYRVAASTSANRAGCPNRTASRPRPARVGRNISPHGLLIRRDRHLDAEFVMHAVTRGDDQLAPSASSGCGPVGLGL